MLSQIEKCTLFKSEKKSLLILIPNAADLIQYKVLEKPCKNNHPTFHMLSSKIEKSVKYNFISDLNKTIKNFTDTNPNVRVLVSYLPAMKLADNIKVLFDTQRDKFNASMKCSCRFPGLKVAEKRDFIANYKRLISGINNQIFEKKWSWFGWKNSYRFLDFSPSKLDLHDGKWGLKKTEDYKIDSLNLAENVDLMVFGKLQFNIPQSTKSSKCKVFLLGDQWIKALNEMWSSSCNAKPLFYSEERFEMETMEQRILSFTRKNDSYLVIASLGFHNFFEEREYPACFEHKVLKYPVLKEELIENPEGFARKFVEKIRIMIKNIESRRANTKVLFTTSFPISFDSLDKFLVEEHLKLTNHRIFGSLYESRQKALNNFSLNKAFLYINSELISINKEKQFPSCDLFKFCVKLRHIISNGLIPLYRPQSIPNERFTESAIQLFKQYLSHLMEEIDSRHLSISSSLYDEIHEKEAIDIELVQEQKELMEKPILPVRIEVKKSSSSKSSSKTYKEKNASEEQSCDIYEIPRRDSAKVQGEKNLTSLTKTK